MILLDLSWQDIDSFSQSDVFLFDALEFYLFLKNKFLDKGLYLFRLEIKFDRKIDKNRIKTR